MMRLAVVLALISRTHTYSPSILVADGLAPSALALLKNGGATVVDKHYSQAELGAVLGEHDAVIIRSATTLTPEIISAGAAGKLRVIGRAGVGVDNVDVAAARHAGCWVLNSPGAPTTSLVELTLAHMLAAARGLQSADVGLKSHKWLKGQIRLGADGGPRQGHELSGKRLGLLGFGRAAKGVAAAASALGMQVHAYSRPESAQQEAHEAAAARMGVTLSPSIEQLFKACAPPPGHPATAEANAPQHRRGLTRAPHTRGAQARTWWCCARCQTRPGGWWPPLRSPPPPALRRLRRLHQCFRACRHRHRPLLLDQVGRACMEQMQQYGADGTPCGAHLFNLARGGIVVEEDAAACLEEGTLATYSAAAGRDEPPGPS